MPPGEVEIRAARPKNPPQPSASRLRRTTPPVNRAGEWSFDGTLERKPGRDSELKRQLNTLPDFHQCFWISEPIAMFEIGTFGLFSCFVLLYQYSGTDLKPL